MLSCIWYIPHNIPTWERSLIGSMAAALKSRAEIIIYAAGGVNDIKFNNAFSWQALTSLERLKHILFSGKRLWHLWGDAPSWWPLIKLHARTVQTLNFNFNNNKNFKWQGCPSRLFPDTKNLNGEFILIPSFEEAKAANNIINHAAASQSINPAVYASPESMSKFKILSNLNIKLDGKFIEVINNNNFNLKSGVFVADSFNISDALRAAAMSMQGLAVAAAQSDYLDKLLGRDGYFVLDCNDEDAQREVILKALSEQGRRMAAAARHFIKENYSADKCADSFIELYKNILK